MISPTLSRIEMDKYLISREKSFQTKRKKERLRLWLSCMSLILTVLVFGQDWPGCCQWFRLSNLIFSKNSELVFFSLLCNTGFRIWFFSSNCDHFLYFPRSLTVKFVLDVTACLDQASEATQNFSMRYSRGRPPESLDFSQESLHPLAVTFDTNRRSLGEISQIKPSQIKREIWRIKTAWQLFAVSQFSFN